MELLKLGESGMCGDMDSRLRFRVEGLGVLLLIFINDITRS